LHRYFSAHTRLIAPQSIFHMCPLAQHT
jgi:hypothetical protein